MWRTIERGFENRNQFPKGFTLLEILVAVAIMGIAVIPLYMALNAALTSWRRGSDYQQAYQNARGAVDSIARDLASVVHFPKDPATRFIVSQQYDGTAKWMTFTMTVDRTDCDLARVLYFTIPEDYSLRRATIYQKWKGDSEDGARALFEIVDVDSSTQRTVFPLSPGVAGKRQVANWEEFDAGVGSYLTEDFLDPRQHTPVKGDGAQAAVNIIDIRFSFYFTKDVTSKTSGFTAFADGAFDEKDDENIFLFRPAESMDAGTDRFNTGWYSHWEYYPDPDDPGGEAWPPSLEYERMDWRGNPIPVGIPMAVGIEVKATDDGEKYKKWLDEPDTNPKPAVVAVSQTVWLTPKWMSP